MKNSRSLRFFAIFSASCIAHITIIAIDPVTAMLLMAQTSSSSVTGESRIFIYFCILFGGLLGGFIYSISQNRGFVLPNRYSMKDGENNEFSKVGLGTLADMLVGVGGGILIFLLVPYAGDGDLITTLAKNLGTETEASSLLKVIALALIGGFAGISLFDEASKRIAHQVQQLEVTATTAAAIAGDNTRRINDWETATTAAATQEEGIQFFLSPLLDPSISPLKTEQARELVEQIIGAPTNIRNWVFSQAQDALDTYWLMGQAEEQIATADVETNREFFKQLILPFEALVQAAEKEQRETNNVDRYLHRYFAHIAFCQQQIAVGSEVLGINGEALSNWLLAEENLTKAIQNRRDIRDLQELFWHYEIYRSLCYYKLGNEAKAKEELKSIKSTWLGKSSGVLAKLLKSLDRTFIQWVQTIDSKLVSASLAPTGNRSPSSSQREDSIHDTKMHESKNSEFGNENGHRVPSQRDEDEDHSWQDLAPTEGVS